VKTVTLNGIAYEDSSFSQRFARFLTDPWKNYLLPVPLLRRVTQLSRSRLIAESHRAPGSWRSMEIIYENLPPVDFLDRMAVRDNPISMAARNRRKWVVHELTEQMRRLASEPVIHVLGVGAGPGLQVQEAYHAAGLPASRLNAVFVDLDESAFSYGLAKAREFGLEQSVTYLSGDARKIEDLFPQRRFHLVKLVGIIEYLDDAAVVELSSAIRRSMDPQGALLTHGIADPHHAMPFLERVFQLKHHHRTGEHVRGLLSKAGFGEMQITHLPMGVYSMVSAQPRRDAATLNQVEQAA
jgi:SAM-dependent methyltransferase